VLWAVETWTHWEHSLTSTKTYSNPYAEVTLKVNYSGPDQQALQGLGFTWRRRAAKVPKRLNE